jgi:hypothetical protein
MKVAKKGGLYWFISTSSYVVPYKKKGKPAYLLPIYSPLPCTHSQPSPPIFTRTDNQFQLITNAPVLLYGAWT